MKTAELEYSLSRSLSRLQDLDTRQLATNELRRSLLSLTSCGNFNTAASIMLSKTNFTGQSTSLRLKIVQSFDSLVYLTESPPGLIPLLAVRNALVSSGAASDPQLSIQNVNAEVIGKLGASALQSRRLNDLLIFIDRSFQAFNDFNRNVANKKTINQLPTPPQTENDRTITTKSTSGSGLTSTALRQFCGTAVCLYGLYAGFEREVTALEVAVAGGGSGVKKSRASLESREFETLIQDLSLAINFTQTLKALTSALLACGEVLRGPSSSKGVGSSSKPTSLLPLQRRLVADGAVGALKCLAILINLHSRLAASAPETTGTIDWDAFLAKELLPVVQGFSATLKGGFVGEKKEAIAVSNDRIVDACATVLETLAVVQKPRVEGSWRFMLSELRQLRLGAKAATKTRLMKFISKVEKLSDKGSLRRANRRVGGVGRSQKSEPERSISGSEQSEHSSSQHGSREEEEDARGTAVSAAFMGAAQRTAEQGGAEILVAEVKKQCDQASIEIAETVKENVRKEEVCKRCPELNRRLQILQNCFESLQEDYQQHLTRCTALDI